MRALLWSLAAAVVVAGAVAACRENPSIDGTKVSTVPKPTCGQACERLASLCGYAPADCEGQCQDGGYDDVHLDCVGVASSCQDALGCANEETEEGGEAEAGADGDEEADPDAGEIDGGEVDGGDPDAA